MTRQGIDVDQLKRERMRVLEEAGNIISTANENDRELNQDEQKKYDGLMADAKRRLSQIRNEEEMRLAESANDPQGQPVVKTHPSESGSFMGMRKDEVQSYSIRKLIAAKAGLIQKKDARMELELSSEIALKTGGADDERTAHVPMEVGAGVERRDITISTEGTDIKETTLQPPIELLRNKLITRAAGARVITGLSGDVQFPKHTGADNNANWIAEGVTDHAERTQTFGQLLLQPKQLGAFTEITRKALLQSSFDMEQFIRDELATTLAIELDRAALHGSGSSNEPTGVAATSNIGSVTLGTSGSSVLSYSQVVQLETLIATSNADVGALAYITNPKVRGVFKTKEKATNTGLFWWQDPANIAPGMSAAPLNGYPALVTNQVSSTLTKGTGTGLSAIFFGNWQELIIAMWADLSLLVDPYTRGASGAIRVISILNADIGVRHPESFAAILDYLAT